MINKLKTIKLINQNRGQVAVIVLLASAIIMTLGLSASQKAITDTKVNTDEELLKEAFNAAESGINNYLNTGSNTYVAGDGNNATVNSTPIGNSNSLSSEGQVLANTSQLFWLVNHNTNGTIGTNYYNGSSISIAVDSGYNGALKIDYFYLESGIHKVQRLGCNYGGSSTVSGFDSSTSSCSTLTVTGRNPLLIVITPLGSSTTITISGTSPFPLQGEELTSVGITNSGVKTQVKTRNVYQVPSFFIEAITAKNVVQ